MMLNRWLIVIISIGLLSSTGLSFADVPFVDRPEVKQFINEIVERDHLNSKELNSLFAKVKVRKTVMRNIKAPLELRPWHTYQMLFVSEWRIRKGVEFWNLYQTQLADIEKKYGVPASIIVATIGVETKYGLHTGEYPVIDALTNIAFSHSPRSPFFRYELEQFLLLCRERHLDPLTVMGSYAGAIGQPQFMPSSYRRYAVSYAGDGKIDLSHNEADIIASIGNYYKQKGWDTGKPIAVPASLLSKKYEFYFNKDKQVKIVTKTSIGGYGSVDTLLKQSQSYKVIELLGPWGNEYWLGFHNFDVIKRYNTSDLYAMAVFQLSHYIETLRKQLGET